MSEPKVNSQSQHGDQEKDFSPLSVTTYETTKSGLRNTSQLKTTVAELSK